MARRNAGDGVPYSTIIKHITLYKWRVPCRGQAPGPQVGAAFIWLRRKNKFVCRGRPPDVPPARSAVVLSLPFQGSWREAPERSPIRACGAAGGRGRPPLQYRIFTNINHITMREAQFMRRTPQFMSEGQFTAAHSAARSRPTECFRQKISVHRVNREASRASPRVPRPSLRAPPPSQAPLWRYIPARRPRLSPSLPAAPR